MRVINLLTYPLLALAAAVVLCPLPLNGQSQSLNLRKQAVKAVAEQGMPERGRFEFIYSYSGEAVDATITLTKNGAVVARQSGLAPVSNATLADLTVKQGDVLVLTSTFNGNASTAVLAPGLGGHPQGLWVGRGSGAFVQVDESGNIINVFGTWQFGVSLTPPWNGIEVEASPREIAPGEVSAITLQAVEAPGTPVIVPDVTAIRVQTGLIGRLAGGLSLPGFGYRYLSGFSGAYKTVTGITILYEAFPEDIFPFDSAAVGVIAYSPYDLSINGSASITVAKEEEEDIVIAVTTEKSSVYPQQTGGIATTQVTVQVSRGDEPVSEFSVSLKARAVPNSGGHHHNGTRPAGSLEPTSGTTDEAGRFVTTYTSSQVSGTERIIVSSSQSTGTGRAEISVQVPGLVELTPGSHYDMSLKNGGLFDFKNNWSPSHKSHRVGTNADIGFKAIGPDGECKENLNRRDLRQRIFKATQIDPYEESDHFHIYVK